MPRVKRSNPNDAARAKLAIAVAAVEFGVPDLDLQRPQDRAPLTDYARQAAMYLTHCSFDLTLTRIGELFKRDRSTVSHALRVIEDGRSDPVLDEKLARLEGWLVSVPFA